jgi:hypothetical protein
MPYSGTYESDEGRVTLFERDGALRFREKDEDVAGTPWSTWETASSRSPAARKDDSS